MAPPLHSTGPGRCPIASRERTTALRSTDPVRGVDVTGAATQRSCLTSAFKAATSSKRRDLRILAANPCLGVTPPGDRDSRKVRHKSFVYSREAAALLACEAVPLHWREVHALAAYTDLRPGELRVLTWADVDLEGGFVSVTKAWDYEAAAVKPPKTRNGVRRVPIERALAPLLRRMDNGRTATELVAPVLSTVADNSLGELFREHMATAGVDRESYRAGTRTHALTNFRSWRDSGITWLAMMGLGVDRMMRRAGHDVVQTTMGYMKLAEDMTGELGAPFGPLPQGLVDGVRPSGGQPTGQRRVQPLGILAESKGFETARKCSGKGHFGRRKRSRSSITQLGKNSHFVGCLHHGDDRPGVANALHGSGR